MGARKVSGGFLGESVELRNCGEELLKLEVRSSYEEYGLLVSERHIPDVGQGRVHRKV
jgi:hypothetical protein